MRAELYLGDLKDRKRIVDLGVDGKIMLEYKLRERCDWLWTGLIFYVILEKNYILMA